MTSSAIRLTSPAEQDQIIEIAERHVAGLSPADLRALDYAGFLEALTRGVAAHHAGLLPAFKECVEETFVRGLTKVVFATETLALGINMPARSVVLEKLVKYNGETHADITPGEYTQLTGRAGRRGIDVEGHWLVLGDDRPQITALVTLDPDGVAAWLQQHGRPATPVAGLTEDPDLLAAIKESVTKANRGVSSAEGIKKIRVFPVDWTEQSGHLTPSLKMKRP